MAKKRVLKNVNISDEQIQAVHQRTRRTCELLKQIGVARAELLTLWPEGTRSKIKVDDPKDLDSPLALKLLGEFAAADRWKAIEEGAELLKMSLPDLPTSPPPSKKPPTKPPAKVVPSWTSEEELRQQGLGDEAIVGFLKQFGKDR